MGFGIDKLGVWSPDLTFAVDAQRTAAYAAATNDPIAAHRDGTLAPPIFAVVPVWDALAGAMATVTPPEVLMLVVHGEQDIFFHESIVPGMTLTSRAAPIGIHVKPSGTTVVCRAETRDETGMLLVEQYFTTFFRGVSEGEGAGENAPDHRLDASVATAAPVVKLTQQLDLDQTYRYAEASGDQMPIHLDDEIACSVGLPGIIIHGLCTMAFTSWAAITELADGDPRRLRRLAVRFSKPVLPGQAIDTSFWSLAAGDGTTRFGFETRNPDGDLVIKDGLAEIG
jgi:acyl dehydratase